MTKIILIIAAVIACSSALPKYLKTCKRYDPNLEKCMVEQGRKVILNVAKGDRHLKVPPLNPLHMDKLDLIHTDTLNLIFTNLTIGGLPEVVLEKFDFDLEKKHGKVTLFSDQFVIRGDYVIGGQILILPISGEGFAEISTNGARAFFNFDFDIIKKKNKKYVHLTKAHTDFVLLKDVKIHLGNLFNGDKLLGDHMNAFLTNNGADVINEVKVPIGELLNRIGLTIATGYFEEIPFDELFPI